MLIHNHLLLHIDFLKVLTKNCNAFWGPWRGPWVRSLTQALSLIFKRMRQGDKAEATEDGNEDWPFTTSWLWSLTLSRIR
jgi:hypothetical protein